MPTDTPTQIINFLTENNLLASPNVTLLGQGEQHINFLATDGNQKIVVRAMRDDISHKAGFGQECKQYKFLEHIGIGFAPRSIFYDAEQEIHAVSYVEGTDTSVVGLRGTELKIFVEQLSMLDEITYDQYLQFCGQTATDPVKPQEWSDREKLNIYDRLANIKAHRADDFASEVTAWAEQKLERYRQSFAHSTPRLHFLHGDLRFHPKGGNLRVNGSSVNFIDWEMSRFVHDAVSEIGDIIGSITEHKRYKELIRSLIQLHRAVSTDVDFDGELEHAILYNTLGGPLWSAERYLTLKEEGHKDHGWYAKYTKDMIAVADYYYNKDSTEWFK